MEIECTRPWIADYQREAIFCPERYALIEASTKAGKTAACLIWLYEQAALGKPGANHWWIAPVYPQAEIAFRRMKAAMPRQVYRSNDTERWIELVHNGARLWFKSGEKPDNLFGEDVHSAVIDEASRVREESWHAVRSTLTATEGPVRIIGNVKGRGNWFYAMARRAQKGSPGMHYSRITAHDAVAAGILNQAEIDDARVQYPPSVFRELYEAEPSDLSGLVYKSFSAENYDGGLVDDGLSPIMVGMDFNVDPMTAVIGRRAVDEFLIFDEIVVRDSNTEQMAREIRNRYPAPRPVTVYPDPSGNSRKTSAPVGQTDFAILRQFDFAVQAPKAAPPVIDRINSVNALCCNAAGQTRLRVNPNGAPLLVESLENLTYKPNTSIPNEAQVGHSRMQLVHETDALGYVVHMEFPIIQRRLSVGFVPDEEYARDVA